MELEYNYNQIYYNYSLVEMLWKTVKLSFIITYFIIIRYPIIRISKLKRWVGNVQSKSATFSWVSGTEQGSGKAVSPVAAVLQ